MKQAKPAPQQQTTQPAPQPEELQVLPYMVGGQSLTAVIIVWLIKRWLNGMLAKISTIDTILTQLIEFKKDFEHIKEKLSEMKPTVKKVDSLSDQVAILHTHVSAAHKRLDDVLNNN